MSETFHFIHHSSCFMCLLGVCRIGGWDKHIFSQQLAQEPTHSYSFPGVIPGYQRVHKTTLTGPFTRNTHKCLRMRVTKQSHPLLSQGPTPKIPHQTRAVGGQSSVEIIRKRATSYADCITENKALYSSMIAYCITSSGVSLFILKYALVTIAFIFFHTLGCGVST